jgi:nucleotide-binding universal stress UspA family protein
MELGCSMAELHDAQLHVLHSLEFPETDSAFPGRIPAEKVSQMRGNAEQHIKSQLANYRLAHTPRIHVVTETPDHAVLHHIEKFAVELMAMGTVARTGISGFLTGNTAERLLPQIPCSVLAVKPRGFVSPLSV